MSLDIQHLSNLARIEVRPEEEAAIVAKIEAVLGYVAELSEVDTEMYAHSEAPEHRNVLRDDISVQSTYTERKTILENAPQRHGDLFKVQKMIG